MPVVILGSLLGGATTVQSSALAALFALLVQTFVQRELNTFADVRRVMSDSISVVGGVLVILAVAVGFTTLPDRRAGADTDGWTGCARTSSRRCSSCWRSICSCIVVGCLMDIFSAIVVVVPLIVPIAAHFGIDPVHLGVIFIANLELGYLTPPVGLNLFLSSYRFNKPVMQIARATLPMLGVLAVGVLFITYVPWLTTGLLDLLGRAQP